MSEEKKKEQQFLKLDTKLANSMDVVVEGKEGRVYKFVVPFHAPLIETYYAAINAANEVARIFNEEVKKQADKEKEKAEKEEIKESEQDSVEEVVVECDEECDDEEYEEEEECDDEDEEE